MTRKLGDLYGNKYIYAIKMADRAQSAKFNNLYFN